MMFTPSSVVTLWSFLLVDQMEAMNIPEILKQLWKKWDIRIMILLSLFIQTIIIFVGRVRKFSTTIMIRICLWSSYLLADWVAAFALGRLSYKMDGSSSSSNAINAFWASFLILHLGGPDTITAYAMEDNELWLRHLLALCYEIFVACYVFYVLSLPNSLLLAPTLLIFFVGIIKYVERTVSLYKASTKNFCHSIDSARELVCFSSTNLKIEALKTFKKCFESYTIVKPCFVDLAIFNEKILKANNFLKRMRPNELLEVLDLELSFVYDEIYTKAVVNHSIVGYILRTFCTICIWLAFILFVFAPKVSFNKVDVTITYVLLAASIILDTTAIFMLIFSDWMVLFLINGQKVGHLTQQVAKHIVKFKCPWLNKSSWSIEMPQLNIFSDCLKHIETKEAPWQRMINWIKKKLGLVEETKLFPGIFSHDNTYKTYSLRALQPIKVKPEHNADIVAYALRLLDRSSSTSIENLTSGLPETSYDKYFLKWVNLSSVFPKTDSLDREIIIWHIATELCFHRTIQVMENTLEKDVCKYLSNYMMHMVVMRREMMSTMRGGTTSLIWLGYHSMLRFLDRKDSNNQLFIQNANVEDICRVMWDFNFHQFSGDDIHNDAKLLAIEILQIEEEQIWQVLTIEWVELLIKAGKHYRANVILKQLTKEGGPLTYIWLLTKHMRFYEYDIS